MVDGYYCLFGNVVRQAIIDYQDYYKHKEEWDKEYEKLYNDVRRKGVGRRVSQCVFSRCAWVKARIDNGESAREYIFSDCWWGLARQIKRFGLKLNIHAVRKLANTGVLDEADNRDSEQFYGNNSYRQL